ncbi:hypothetical protein BKA56DRAFT_610898 [Ilyonectria sp. MPI-CAGE-AT-0026]|nr:hypothetical protein BKA56DRAFT_610898 [Ilyonectria sp. MPI-CAGE-AT-0026]
MLRAPAEEKAETSQAREETERVSQPTKALEASVKNIEPLLPIFEKLERLPADAGPKEEREATQKAIVEAGNPFISAHLIYLKDAVVPSSQRLHWRMEQLPTSQDLDASVKVGGSFLIESVENAANRVVMALFMRLSILVAKSRPLWVLLQAVSDRVGQVIAQATVDITHVGPPVGDGMSRAGETVARACADLRGLVIQAGSCVKDAIVNMGKSVSGVSDVVNAVDESTTQLNAILRAKLAGASTLTQGQELMFTVASRYETQTEKLETRITDMRHDFKESYETVVARIGSLPGVDHITMAVAGRTDAIVQNFSARVSDLKEDHSRGLSDMATNRRDRRDVVLRMDALDLQFETLEQGAISKHMTVKAKDDAATMADKARLEDNTVKTTDLATIPVSSDHQRVHAERRRAFGCHYYCLAVVVASFSGLFLPLASGSRDVG